jgi:hypothetical protein
MKPSKVGKGKVCEKKAYMNNDDSNGSILKKRIEELSAGKRQYITMIDIESEVIERTTVIDGGLFVTPGQTQPTGTVLMKRSYTKLNTTTSMDNNNSLFDTLDEV